MRTIKNKIIFKDVKEEVTTGGGIILAPETTPYRRGLVTAIGKAVEEVEVGDIIVLDKRSGKLIENGNFVVTEDEVQAIEASK